MDEKQKLPAPPDEQIIERLYAGFPRSGWQNKSEIMTCVNRRNWPAEGYRYPSWHQVKRCLRHLMQDDDLVYRFYVHGQFRAHEYRWSGIPF
jgi:hypothetical protein